MTKIEKIKKIGSMFLATSIALTFCSCDKKSSENGNTKFFFSLGKKDNIKAKDIVGSIASNVPISGSEIGKINIMDKFSFVEIPTRYAEEFLDGMMGKQIKGKNVVIEVANK